MKKLITLLSISTLSFSTFANCPGQTNINTQIILDVAPLIFDTSLLSRQLKTSHMHGYYSLGLYESQRSIQVNPQIQLITSPRTKTTCSNVQGITVKITLNPKIYLAREILNFSCTSNRVKRHELQHHQFEIKSQIDSETYLKNMVLKHYKNQTFRNPQEAEYYYKQQNKYFMQEISDFYKNNTKNLHAMIDSKENYDREKAECSNAENRQLENLLR